jgi:hypothetical protein
MKKIVFFVLCFMMMYACAFQVEADSNYHAYEELNVNSGKLLDDYTTSEYKKYYKKVTKRKFLGWRTYIVHSDLEANYITETKFSYYNDGYTPISYHYEYESSSSSKLALAATGSIALNNTSTKTSFKNNLQGSLKLSADYQQTKEETESVEIDFEVDAGTQVDLYIYGEGLVTNGVAARYFFWIRAQKGGFELFLITTQYQRLEKTRI